MDMAPGQRVEKAEGGTCWRPGKMREPLEPGLFGFSKEPSSTFRCVYVCMKAAEDNKEAAGPLTTKTRNEQDHLILNLTFCPNPDEFWNSFSQKQYESVYCISGLHMHPRAK